MSHNFPCGPQGGKLSQLIPSLVPRPTPFFVLRFAFSRIHGGGRARKTGKAWEHLSRE